MEADVKSQAIRFTRSWANKDIADFKLALIGYALFRKDRRERRRGGVILYIT